MPITDTLKTAEEFKDVGFTEDQSNLLANKMEEAVLAQNQDLKTFFIAELDRRFDLFESRINVRIAELRTELHSSLRDQTFKFITVMMAMTSLAVAVIKLFPNL